MVEDKTVISLVRWIKLSGDFVRCFFIQFMVKYVNVISICLFYHLNWLHIARSFSSQTRKIPKSLNVKIGSHKSAFHLRKDLAVKTIGHFFFLKHLIGICADSEWKGHEHKDRWHVLSFLWRAQVFYHVAVSLNRYQIWGAAKNRSKQPCRKIKYEQLTSNEVETALVLTSVQIFLITLVLAEMAHTHTKESFILYFALNLFLLKHTFLVWCFFCDY